MLMNFLKLNWSQLLSLGAFAISTLALVVPLFRSRQSAKIKEVLAVPTLPYATWLYVVVANHSTAPLSIYGATLDGIRVYRHRHYFANRSSEGKQYTSEFPMKIGPQSAAGILMEFVDRKETGLDRTHEITLVLNADRGPLKKNIVISQVAVEVETALQEI